MRGLLWRSHLEMFGYQVRQNRTFAGDVNAAGGQVLPDQRIRRLGCHHQKLMVIRHESDSRDDLAFVGGLDPDSGSRDDAAPFFALEGGIEAARELVETAGDEVAELFVHPGDRRLFTDSSLVSYDPAATRLVIERSLAFLDRTG